MKKLLKIFFPPFIVLSLFFIAVRYSPYYFELKPDKWGDGTMQSFMSYYRYVWPLILVTAILTQVLIFIPIWNRVIEKPFRAILIAFLSICLVCFILAAGIAYAMWDSFSRKHLINLCLFMTGVQIGYWLMNAWVMYLIDGKRAHTIEETD